MSETVFISKHNITYSVVFQITWYNGDAATTSKMDANMSKLAREIKAKSASTLAKRMAATPP